jgi:zinc transporter 2
LSNSIAIFTDTAHLASDMVGFGISILSLYTAQKPATKALSFGYHRAEVLGTLVSIILIWALTVWLVVEATARVWHPVEIVGNIMLITAVAGLFFNLIQMKILHSGDGHYHLGGDAAGGGCGGDHASHEGHAHNHKEDHKHVDQEALKENLVSQSPKATHNHGEHNHDGPAHAKAGTDKNINVTAAYLHVLGDMLMSVGVIIAATIIFFCPTYTIADPVCTYLFSVIICFTTIPVFKECILVMMEATPSSLDAD